MKYTLKNKDIELTDDELDELNAQRDEKTERFVPTKEDNYWFVQSNKMVNIMTWINSSTENYLLYNQAVGTIREYILEQNGDWMPSSNENKYYLCHDNPILPGEWFCTWEYYNYSGAIGAYAESSQIIKYTIEKYPEELEIIRDYVSNHNV